jgi:hypothetical protein
MGTTSQTVFIAYARADWKWLEKTSTQLRVLEPSMDISVWSDKEIGGGDEWLVNIEEAISRASLAILLISARFLTSDFILRKEVPDLLARKSKDDLPILLILIRDCAWKRVPWLEEMQIRPNGAKPLANYSTAKADTHLADITDEVAQLLEKNAPKIESGAGKSVDLSVSKTSKKLVERLSTLPVGGLALPCFFPSVSGSAKSNFSPLAHLEVLVKLKHPCFLASVYDFVKISRSEKISRKDRLKMLALIEEASENGQVILLDSGLYERKWLHDSTWSRRSFHAALAGIRCHLGFFFDSVEVKAKSSLRKYAVAITTQVRSDRRLADLEALFPIVHPKKIGNPESLPELCKLVALDLDCDIIAVAERELGNGIQEGIKTMLSIRRALNETGRYRIIHLLGTGNPLSILVYASCGADSFDGLDWCQTVVDYEDQRLYHNQQIDFFRGQSVFAETIELGHPTRMLGHNLLFYRDWMNRIQDHITSGTLPDLLKEALPKQFCDDLLKLLKDGVS